MTIFEQINNDIKAAMKAREKARLEALRNIKKAMLEAKTAKGATAELTDEEAIKIIAKLNKQGTDSATIYKEQGREDLYHQEMEQVAVFEQYLPAKLSTEEIAAEVKKIIAQVGATTMKDMGKVMGIASKALAGKADGREISEQVKKLLS